MSDFVNFVGGYLVRAAAGAALVAAFGALILWAAAKHHKKKHGAEQPFPWARSVLLLLLAVYLAAVLFVTVRGSGYYTGSANFHLFRAWREAWNSFSERAWLNVLLNIAMFVPLGILLPLIWKKLQRWYLMLPAGFLTSLFIEISQLLKGSGLFDVDDLFTNTLGAMIGFWTDISPAATGSRKKTRTMWKSHPASLPIRWIPRASTSRSTASGFSMPNRATMPCRLSPQLHNIRPASNHGCRPFFRQIDVYRAVGGEAASPPPLGEVSRRTA